VFPRCYPHFIWQTMNREADKVFLITGVSAGFGRAFAEAAVRAGHTVVGTVRRESDIAAFEAIDPQRAHAVLLDVTHFDAIDGTVASILARFGRIDVLVNNAGYGHEGVLEESSLEALRHQFDVNVFGSVAMIKAVLPGMRARRSGHIVNLSSMAGYAPLPGIAYYAGSKFAIEGISGVLAKEVAPFGIKVTALAPGSFRTDWAGRSMVRSERSIADYDALFDPIRKARHDKSGQQSGDPALAAQVLMDVIDAQHPPVHLLLGEDALSLVRKHLAALSDEIDTWEVLSRSTEFASTAS
jgi:NAD(P)-dependent dehydrogenase (short-subunit alcohol dehydrogenase family)